MWRWPLADIMIVFSFCIAATPQPLATSNPSVCPRIAPATAARCYGGTRAIDDAPSPPLRTLKT